METEELHLRLVGDADGEGLWGLGEGCMTMRGEARLHLSRAARSSAAGMAT